MKDENNQNLFETVFQGVEPPKDTNINDGTVNTENIKEAIKAPEIHSDEPSARESQPSPVEQSSVVNPAVITDQTELNAQSISTTEMPVSENIQGLQTIQSDISEQISVPIETDPAIDSKEISTDKTPVDDKKLNPLVRLIVYLLLLAAVLFSLYNLIVVPIMKTAQEKEVEHARLEKVEDYLKAVEVSLQSNSDLQKMETCQIVSSGKYCTTDEDIIDESSALKVQTKQTVEGGMLFFRDGLVYSGYVYLDGHTFDIQDGVVKEKEVIEETPEEEQ